MQITSNLVLPLLPFYEGGHGFIDVIYQDQRATDWIIELERIVEHDVY